MCDYTKTVKVNTFGHDSTAGQLNIVGKEDNPELLVDPRFWTVIFVFVFAFLSVFVFVGRAVLWAKVWPSRDCGQLCDAWPDLVTSQQLTPLSSLFSFLSFSFSHDFTILTSKCSLRTLEKQQAANVAEKSMLFFPSWC